jgi:transcriptional regulator with XRE-family HTH domain
VKINLLRTLRKHSGVNLRKLARDSGVSETLLCQIEHRVTPWNVLSLRQSAQICEALGYSPMILFCSERFITQCAKSNKTLRQIREECGHTLKSLSEVTECCSSTLSKIERGKGMVTVKEHNRNAICRSLGISFAEFELALYRMEPKHVSHL